MRMTARWDRHQDISTEAPRSIIWEDGTSASLDDFRSHSSHTSRFAIGLQGKKEVHIYPDVVAEVYFDRYAKSWAIRGEGVTACALDVCDRHAIRHRHRSSYEGGKLYFFLLRPTPRRLRLRLRNKGRITEWLRFHKVTEA
jgi:hypothetical protein